MASPPASTKTSLGQKLRARARARWPQLTSVDVRFRGKFAYVSGQLPDGQNLPLCRLRYAGYASLWGFAIYRASHDDYQDSVLPSGQFAGTPEEALDCACGLYLGDPNAWLPPEADTPTNLRAGPLGGRRRLVAGARPDRGRLRRGRLKWPPAAGIMRGHGRDGTHPVRGERPARRRAGRRMGRGRRVRAGPVNVPGGPATVTVQAAPG